MSKKFYISKISKMTIQLTLPPIRVPVKQINLLIQRWTWPSSDLPTRRGPCQRNSYINKCLNWPSADSPTRQSPCQVNEFIIQRSTTSRGSCKINSFVNKTLNCPLTLPPVGAPVKGAGGEYRYLILEKIEIGIKIVLTTFWNRQLLPPSVLLLCKISAKMSKIFHI